MSRARFPWPLCLALAPALVPWSALPVFGCAQVTSGGGGGDDRVVMAGASPEAIALAPSVAPSTAQEAGVVPFRLLESGASSGIHENTETVIKDESHWEAFYARHNAAKQPQKVDFTKEMVVAVVLNRLTGGYSVKFGPVSTDGTQMTATYTETEPAANAITIQILTQPYAFAAVPSTSLPVHFQHLVTVRGSTTPPSSAPSAAPSSKS